MSAPARLVASLRAQHEFEESFASVREVADLLAKASPESRKRLRAGLAKVDKALEADHG